MRNLPTGFATETEKTVFRPVLLVFLDWPSGPARFWSGYGPFSWDGHIWSGTGKFGSIEGLSESSDRRANGVVLKLTGIPSEMLADALANDSQGRSAMIWIAPMNDAGALAAEPYQLKNALIDICPITDDGVTGSISVQIESELIDNRVNVRRRTHEDQQLILPGDRYYEYTAGLADKQITWGPRTVNGNTGGAGGYGSAGAGTGGVGGGAGVSGGFNGYGGITQNPFPIEEPPARTQFQQ